MFDTCTAANRIVTQPILTSFKFEFTKGITSSSEYPLGRAEGYKYIRLRRGNYKYVGCTKACAMQKAKELALLFNRKVQAYWIRDSYNAGYMRAPYYSWIQAADVKVVIDHDLAHCVDVSIDEELYGYYKPESSTTSQKYWVAFENNPDIVCSFFKYNGSATSGSDFEYDGVL